MVTLRHPYIVDVKTVLEDDARILIVMEHLTGGELFDYISNKGMLDEKEARRIFHQIVLALHYCHENNVVHRDLKPENILSPTETMATTSPSTAGPSPTDMCHPVVPFHNPVPAPSLKPTESSSSTSSSSTSASSPSHSQTASSTLSSDACHHYHPYP